MKRREFLHALGIGSAAGIAAPALLLDETPTRAAAMDAEIDPDLEDFVTLVQDMYRHGGQPGWIVVPERTYNMLESELMPQIRFMNVDLAERGHQNLMILGMPVIPLRARKRT